MPDQWMIREAKESDLLPLLRLYLHLHETKLPDQDDRLIGVWQSILSDENHHVIVSEVEKNVVASCVCVVIPNLTRNARPYALIENVVTHPDFRRQGHATACLRAAEKIARARNCYKIMLLTGAKDEGTLQFYRNAGYNSSDKTAFIEWL